MGAPFTQAFIQAKIDFFAAQMETSAQAEQYSYDQGPIGQFGVKKTSLNSAQKSLDYWIGLMDKYYPDAFTESPKIVFNEIGVLSG